MQRKLSIIIPLFVLILLTAAGCADEAERLAHQKALASMDHAAAVMEDYPDSGLAILQSIDSAALIDRPTRARFSLLMAMADDKTGDITDMSIVQEAIDYYADHGTPTEQMLADFYEGRTYKNNHKLAHALKCYLRGEKRGEKSTDWLIKGRIIVAQGTVYFDLKQWDDWLNADLRGLKYFEKLGIEKHIKLIEYFIADAYSYKKDYVNTRRHLEKCRPTGFNPSSPEQKHYYYQLLLYYQETQQRDSLLELASRYGDLINMGSFDSLDLVDCYLSINRLDMARRYMPANDSRLSGYYRQARWLSLNTLVCRAEGNFEEAARFNRLYNTFQDSILNIETQSAMEVAQEFDMVRSNQTRHEAESKYISVLMWIIAALIPVMTIIAGLYHHKNKIIIKTIIQNEKERKAAERLAAIRIEQLNRELQNVDTLLEETTQRIQEREKSLALLKKSQADKERVQRLNIEIEKLKKANSNAFGRSMLYRKLIATCTKENPTGIKREFFLADAIGELIKDKTDLIKFAVDSLKTEASQIYSILTACGLTETEITICALMRFGFSMKEIGKFLPSIKNHNISSMIRRKLGLQKSDPYLKTILASDTLTDYIKQP